MDLVKSTFGLLTVLTKEYRKDKSDTYAYCQCACGNKKWVKFRDLSRGRTKSCGCLAKSANGLSRTRIYRIWKGMKERCLNPNCGNYKYYGGRGIMIDDLWLDNFLNFYNDMYDSYLAHVKEFGEKNTTIDRIDVNGNYCKENCRWATIKEQANNKTNNIVLNFKGKCLTMAQWAEELGIKYSTLKRRKYTFGYTEAKDLLAQPHKISKEVINN